MKVHTKNKAHLSSSKKLAINIISGMTTEQLFRDLLEEFGGNLYVVYGIYDFLFGLQRLERYETMLGIYRTLFDICNQTVPASVSYVLNWDHAPEYFCSTLVTDIEDFLVDCPAVGDLL